MITTGPEGIQQRPDHAAGQPVLVVQVALHRPVGLLSHRLASGTPERLSLPVPAALCGDH
jgi:hypothetical protein